MKWKLENEIEDPSHCGFKAPAKKGFYCRQKGGMDKSNPKGDLLHRGFSPVIRGAPQSEKALAVKRLNAKAKERQRANPPG